MFISFDDERQVVYKTTASTYRPYFTEVEQELLIEDMTTADVFNGITVRLESLTLESTITLTVSQSHFYDLMTSNLLLDVSSADFRQELRGRVEGFQEEIKADLGRGETSLDISLLENSLGVSVLIYNDDALLLMQRGDRVAISPNEVSTSVVGGLDDRDFGAANPLRHAAIREAKEELNDDLGDAYLHIKGLYFSEKTLKPSALINVYVDRPLETLIQDPGEDFEKENEKALIIPRDRASELKAFNYTETAFYHIGQFLQKKGDHH